MIPSVIVRRPTRNHTGSVLALDLGGWKFSVFEVVSAQILLCHPIIRPFSDVHQYGYGIGGAAACATASAFLPKNRCLFALLSQGLNSSNSITQIYDIKAVMDIELNTFYVARAFRAVQLDADSPLTELLPDPVFVSQQDPRTIIFTEYDESTHIGIAYFCSSLSMETLSMETKRKYRWVPLHPAAKIDDQPSVVLTTDPANYFEKRPTYINFAFKFKVKVHQPGPRGRLPASDYPKAPGTIYNPSPYPVKHAQNMGHLTLESLTMLEKLHTWFWLNRRSGEAPPSFSSAAGSGQGAGGAGGSEEKDGEEGKGRKYGKGEEDGKSGKGAGGKSWASIAGGGGGCAAPSELVTPPAINAKNLLASSSVPSPSDSDILRALQDMAHQSGNIWSAAARRVAGHKKARSIASKDDSDEEDEEQEEEETLGVEGLDERLQLFKSHLEAPILSVELIA